MVPFVNNIVQREETFFRHRDVCIGRTGLPLSFPLPVYFWMGKILRLLKEHLPKLSHRFKLYAPLLEEVALEAEEDVLEAESLQSDRANFQTMTTRGRLLRENEFILLWRSLLLAIFFRGYDMTWWQRV